jgi:tRNA(fMet)-specific endonuclease VapC
MTGNKCLLDTSIIVHAFRSNNQVSEKLDSMEEIYVSVTAIGELYYGAYKSDNAARHLNQMQSFLNNCKILQTDLTTADIYGNIKAALARKGKPIPENDIWIGAAALQYNLPLYTTDGHFNEIDGITLL